MAKKSHDKNAEFPSAFSLFRPSINAVLLNVWTFLALILLPVAGLILVGIAGGAMDSFDGGVATAFVAGLLAAAIVVAVLVVSPALPYVQLMSVKGKQVSIEEAIRAGLGKFWRFYGLSLLTGLIVVAGFLLFVVPGLFMFRRYILAPYYLFDRDLGVMDAMKLSAKDSKRFSGAVWGLLGVIFLIGATSIVPLFFLITAALQVAYYCAPAVRYTQIKKAADK